MSDEKKRRRRKRKEKEQRKEGFTDRMRDTCLERDYTPEVTGQQYPTYRNNRGYVENLLDMAQDNGDYP